MADIAVSYADDRCQNLVLENCRQFIGAFVMQSGTRQLGQCSLMPE